MVDVPLNPTQPNQTKQGYYIIWKKEFQNYMQIYQSINVGTQQISIFLKKVSIFKSVFLYLLTDLRNCAGFFFIPIHSTNDNIQPAAKCLNDL